MARRRLRQEWPVLAYKFWIQPMHVPQQVWDTAKRMQEVWNRLVDLRDAVSERIKTAEPAPGEDEKRAIYAELDFALRQAVNQSELNWECRELILDRFKVAVQRTISSIKNGAPPREVGGPKKRSRLSKVIIPHRYTGGGAPVSRFLKPTPPKSIKRFWLKPAAQPAYVDNARAHKRLRYTEGIFGLDGVKMPFRAVIHRQIPHEAIVKNIILMGNHSRQFGWEWSIVFICELPPTNPAIGSSGRFCGLDLGWRKFDTYLRIGMLVDNAGSVLELRLPLDMSNQRTRRFNRWIEQAGRPDADKIYESWEDLRAATALADKSLESLKAELSRLAKPLPLPDDIRSTLSQITPMRQAGLLRLLEALEQANIGEDLQTLISDWKETDDRARRRIHSARLRLIRRRRTLYHNLAAWIANNYDIISWEAGLGIRAMAEEDGKRMVLKRADRYRHIAAIGEFKKLLKHQAQKRHAMIIDGVAAYSSTTCFSCGMRAEPGPALMLECPNGHSFDQDENAARWFLAKIDLGVRTAFNLREKVAHVLPRRIEVPDSLKSVAA